MRKAVVIVGWLGCLGLPAAAASGQLGLGQTTTRPATAQVSVYFSPDGGCTDAIVKAIAGAKKAVRIQAYSFTSAPIAKAIIDAKKRGIDVTAILDRSNRSDRYSAATFLKNQGATVLIDDAHAIAHNKIILVDDDTVITGSFNFSANAEENSAENLLVISGAEIYRRYAANFADHLRHSKPYAGLVNVDPARAGRSPSRAAQPAARQLQTGTDGRTDTYGGKPTGETTATGLNIYEDPRGGRYHISKSGKKVYEKRQ